MNTVIARTKSAKISPRKVRLVADLVRNANANEALEILKVIRKHGASILAATIKSAVANAVNNKKMPADRLKITKLTVTEGPFLKRYHSGSRGRIKPFKKRTSHITIVLQ